ncbi:hypothetical protein AA0119_g13462 [Alternaria tenuissima]|uniref:F-box domain-containing protein n=1 Tax=Alternaria tenuissima TaxID=119927 RepID=A0ABY0FNL8_9PLEO|nr:hypothetical protein AA0119_g13462 [Alternaria tenuissima]RYN98825.1 hypothetical protein AA0121_g13471 [Alternaria tenuissima]
MAELPSETPNYEEQRFEKHESGNPLLNESSIKNAQHLTPEENNTMAINRVPNELIDEFVRDLEYQENWAFYSTCNRLRNSFKKLEFYAGYKKLDNPDLDEETLKNIVNRLEKQKWTFALFLEKGLSTLKKPELLGILSDAAKSMLHDGRMKKHHKSFIMRVPWERKSMPNSPFVNHQYTRKRLLKLERKITVSASVMPPPNKIK